MEEKKTFKEKLNNLTEEVKRKSYEVVDWFGRNKEAIVIVVPVLCGSFVELTKVITRKSNIREEKRLKDRYIYDPSKRHYYELRKKPSNRDWIEIDERIDRGEPLRQILIDMRLLR